MTYKAVIFDLDGTLLNTIEDLQDAMNVVMAEVGAPGHDVESAKLYVGDGMRSYVLRALPEAMRGDDELVAGCCRRFGQEYAKRWHVKTLVYEGVAELLTELNRRPMPAAVLTNKPDEFTQVVVRKLLGQWRFAAVRGVRADGVKKPDPAGALEIAAKLAVLPAQCLYVGDTNTDMRTAKAAGMFAVGVTWGYRTADELLKSGAAVLIDKPLELLGLLGR